MRNALLAVILLLGIMFVAGCAESGYSSSGSSGSGVASPPPPQAQAQYEAPPPPPSRNTTTQPLPSGWSYIRESDLTPAR